jgi:hypothetical protein
MTRRGRTFPALFYAWLLATLLSGIPSTVYLLLVGGDVMQPTRAAGAMIGRPDSLAAAALVHCAVSLFWAVVLSLWLPPGMPWALLAAAGIALLDLKVLAPLFFPAIAALDFWPQLADHLAWGAFYSVGLSLARPRATRP